jgi:hypothetical protein
MRSPCCSRLLEDMSIQSIIAGLLQLLRLGLAFAVVVSWSRLWATLPPSRCCWENMSSAGLEGDLFSDTANFGSLSRWFHCLLVCFFYVCLLPYSFNACSREPAPLIVPGSLFPLLFYFSKLVLLMVCSRESVPFVFYSASLSWLWFV